MWWVSASLPPTDLPLRLVGRAATLRGPGGGPTRGRVGHGVRRPLEHQGRRVVCRVLELRAPLGALGRSHRPGSGPILLDDVRCAGTEDALGAAPTRAGRATTASTGGGQRRGLRRYPDSPATPGPPQGLPKAPPFLSSPSIPKVRIPAARMSGGPRPSPRIKEMYFISQPWVLNVLIRRRWHW